MPEKLYLLYTYLYHSHLPADKYPAALKKWYKHETGMELDLEHPVTFSEKLQWQKLYDSTKLKADLSDKYLVREWIKEKIGQEYLIPLLGVWDRAADIDFGALPDRFVLKTNHSSGWNIIVKDKSRLNIKKARRKLDCWMKMDYAFCCGLQLHYSLIKRRIVAEEYMENINGLDDIKFLCFAGRPVYVWKDTGRFGDQHFRNVYDLDWNRLDFDYEYKRSPEPDERPECLDEMIRLATVLCQGFNQVRVDFYEVEGRVYFGEMTFTSGSGIDRFDPPEIDARIGALLEL